MVEYEPERFWSEVATHVERRADGNLVAGDDLAYYAYKRKRFLAKFLEGVDFAGTDVLEVGCGPGGNLAVLGARNPARLVGADISQPMLDLAGTTVARQGIDAELVKVDGASLPFGDEEFDVSLTVTVLHHNLDETTYQSLAAEICRVTKHSVLLIEDTLPVLKVGEATIERPVSNYEAILRPHGFSLASAEFLDTRATYFAHRVVVKAWRTLSSRKHDEGAPPPKTVEWADKLAVGAARPLDNVWHDHGGLTKMTFARTS
jgi:ubiquinone/menaquinone biosynthesis C-methylase UbiE